MDLRNVAVRQSLLEDSVSGETVARQEAHMLGELLVVQPILEGVIQTRMASA